MTQCLVGAGVVVAGVLVAASVTIACVRAQRASATEFALRDARECIRISLKHPGFLDNSSTNDEGWTLCRPTKFVGPTYSCVAPKGQAADVIRDGWGNPVIFRTPGPVHRRGWDLYSIGPNGMDEQGQGDDILVGEDLAPVTSR